MLFHRFLHDSLEYLRLIHSEISEYFSVYLDIVLLQAEDKFRVSGTEVACSSVDTHNPKSAVRSFFELASYVSVEQTFLDMVLGYSPDVTPRAPVTFGEF